MVLLFGEGKRRRGPKLLFVLALGAAAATVATLSFSDVKRYVRMRAM